MGIFSAAPKSFLVVWPSPLASDLMSIVSDLIGEILGDLSDDVLAEYVTVLICNRKNQYEARDLLNAFLGKMTEEFVSWLWSFLMEFEQHRLVASESGEKDEASMSSRGSDADKEESTKRAKDFTHQRTGYGNASEKSNAFDFSSSKCNTSAKDEGYSTAPSIDLKRKASDTCSRSEVPSLKGSRSLPSSFTDKYQPLEDPTNVSQGGSSSVKTGLLYSDYKTRLSVWDRLEMPNLKRRSGKPDVDLSIESAKATGALSNVSRHMELPWLPKPTHLITRKTRKALQTMNYASNLFPMQNVDAATTRGTSPTDINSARKRNLGQRAEMRSRSFGYEYNRKGKKIEIAHRVSQQSVQIGAPMLNLQVKHLETGNYAHKAPVGISGDLYSHTLAERMMTTTEDIKSRTVYATNVPVQVTNELILLHFANRGAAAINVFFVPNNKSSSPSATKSAFITFTSKELADKAVG